MGTDIFTKGFWRRRWMSLLLLAAMVGFASCDLALTGRVAERQLGFVIDEGYLGIMVVESKGGRLSNNHDVYSRFRITEPKWGGAPVFDSFPGGFSAAIPVWALIGTMVLWIGWREWLWRRRRRRAIARAGRD